MRVDLPRNQLFRDKKYRDVSRMSQPFIQSIQPLGIWYAMRRDFAIRPGLNPKMNENGS